MSHLSNSVTTHLRAPNTAPVDAPEAQVPADHELVLKVIPLPGDANANGDIFGGWVMAQVDLADILSFYAKMERIGRTSMTVNVGVYAERFNNQGRYIKVTEAQLTYVAIDDEGKPRPVPRTDD